jgi:hypothetical protein
MTTYTQLLADLQDWSVRTDIAAKVPTMVGLFETRVNRTLRTRQMEASFAGTIANNVVALPAGWLEFKRIWPDAEPKSTIHPQTLELVRERIEGVPTLYATDGTNVRFNGAGAVTGVYFQAIPGLVANGTNWLCTVAYDAYLFGVLAEIADYMKDDAAMAKYFARSNAVLDDIAGVNMRLYGPLRAVKR